MVSRSRPRPAAALAAAVVAVLAGAAGHARAQQSGDTEPGMAMQVIDIRPLLMEVPDYRSIISDLHGDDLYGAPAAPPPARVDLEEREAVILGMITSIVAPESWDEMGGEGTAQVYAGQLVMSNRDAVLEQAAQILATLKATRTSLVRVDAWFVLVPRQPADRGGLDELLAKDRLAPGEFARLLAALGDRIGVVRAALSGLDGQRVFVSSGQQRNVQVGSQAVVATSSAAHQPVVRTLTSGVTLEAQPVVDRREHRALLDLRASLGALPPGGPPPADPVSPGAGSTAPPYRVAHFAATISLPLETVSQVGLARYDEEDDVVLFVMPAVR